MQSGPAALGSEIFSGEDVGRGVHPPS